MKKYIKLTLVIAIIFSFHLVVLAEDGDRGNDITKNQEQSIDKATDESTKEAGLTPDKLMYPVEKLIENIQLILTYSDETKAELLIEFADERLAEAEVMNDKNENKLVEELMDTYVETITEANKKLESIVDDDKDKDAIDISEKIAEVQSEVDRILTKISGKFPKDIEQGLKEKIYKEIKKTITVKIFVMAKENYIEAKRNYEIAVAEYTKVKTTGDKALIQKANQELKEARKNLNQLEQIKVEFEKAKEDLN